MSVLEAGSYYSGPVARAAGVDGRRLTIGQKLLGGFLGVALMLAALGAFSIVQLDTLNASSTEIGDDWLPSTRYLGVVDAKTGAFREAQLLHSLTTSEADMGPIERDLEDTRKAVAEALGRYTPLATSAHERELLESFRAKWAAYLDEHDRRFLPLSRADRDDEAAAYLKGDGKKLFDGMEADLGALVELNVRGGQAASAHADGVFADSRKLIVGSVVAALLAALGLGLALARGISRGVRAVTTGALVLSQGDLTQTIEVHSNDEIGDMGAAFHTMSANLRDLLTELQRGSQSLTGATSEILAAVSQQSAGATEQSATIAQTTATVGEVKVSAEQSVSMAVVVSETAQQASRVAGAGVAAVADATDGMGAIRRQVQSIAETMLALSEQTKQIGEIIATVEDLADQSNLLALNAAIEASRAGEQGRGFAVVAAEIRHLAEQSKAATAQVGTILSDIQRATAAAVLATEQGTKGVDGGAERIERAGRTIAELAEVVEQAAQSSHQIAASVRQPSVGMEQVAVAMANINQATTQNLAATASTQAAAENLNDLSARLNQLVARYRI